MNIDYTVTALMFPAIPLIMAVYSNRFHTLSNLIRKIHDEYVFEKHTPPEWKSQLINLNSRIGVLKLSILFAAFGFLFNMGTVFALYLNEIFGQNHFCILLSFDDDFHYFFYKRNTNFYKSFKTSSIRYGC